MGERLIIFFIHFLALQNLNNVTLYEQEMRVSRSKHDNVNMPKAEDEGKELTKEYVNSPLHRFKVKSVSYTHLTLPTILRV